MFVNISIRYFKQIILFMLLIVVNQCFAEEKYTPRVIVELGVGKGPYQVGIKSNEMGYLMPGLVIGDKEGNVYIFDWLNYRISKYSQQGKYLYDILGERPTKDKRGYNFGPGGIDKFDNLYTFAGTDKIIIFDKHGKMIKKYTLPMAMSWQFFVSWQGNISITMRENKPGEFNHAYKYNINGKQIIKIENSSKSIYLEDINAREDADGNIWETEEIGKTSKGFKYRYIKYEKSIDINGKEKKDKRCQMRKEMITMGGVIMGFDGKSNIYIINSDVEKKKAWIEKYNKEGELLVKIPVLYGDGFLTSEGPTIDFHGNIYQLERSPTKIRVICHEKQKGKN